MKRRVTLCDFDHLCYLLIPASCNQLQLEVLHYLFTSVLQTMDEGCNDHKETNETEEHPARWPKIWLGRRRRGIGRKGVRNASQASRQSSRRGAIPERQCFGTRWQYADSCCSLIQATSFRGTERSRGLVWPRNQTYLDSRPDWLYILTLTT